ncbi:hypothetical protein FUAX_27130 [Fulvitalea axinellae]|uniref:STAS/SEC14 domain-containing protein n=1 Tax=Fulvitalea axinellae TaxID=1182444 RepID=A0AAU9CDT4_9BACT|nr:hypothetical protein FUAX_27130 [Fulvitalea axinellae]
MDIYFETNYLQVKYDPKQQLVLQVWDGFVSKRAFEEGVDAITECVIKNKALNMVADTKNLTILPISYLEYSMSRLSEMEESGLRVLFLVAPNNVFASSAVRKFKDREKKGGKARVEIVDTQHKALSWIKTI